MGVLNGGLWRGAVETFCVLCGCVDVVWPVPCSPSDLRLIRFGGIRENIPRIILLRIKSHFTPLAVV